MVESHEWDEPPDDGELNLQAESDRRLYPVNEYLQEATAKFEEQDQEDEPMPERAPMLVGVFEFPWQLGSLAAWIPMSLLLLIAASMQAVFLTYGLQVGLIGVGALGPAAFMATVFAVAYSAACGLKVVEDTADGRVVIDDWPGMLQWQEWAWGLVFSLVILGECGMVALVFTFWSGPLLWIPFVLVTLGLFPLFLLSSIDANAWAPVSRDLPATLKSHSLLWLMFYIEYFGILLIGSGMMALLGVVMLWWALPISCPLLGAIILIEARLIGRLTWCLRQPR